MSEEKICLENLTPKQIVAKLDTYIVGQQKAKKAVAIAMQNNSFQFSHPLQTTEHLFARSIVTEHLFVVKTFSKKNFNY